jgi:hypothetical protein
MDRSSTAKRALTPVRQAIKAFASLIPVKLFHRLLTYSILRSEFPALRTTRVFESRESLWDDCIANVIGANSEITYVEFGVHRGYSIKYFAARNSNPSSVFIGLDSFEGLPEEWGPLAKGAFDVRGSIPAMDDRRANFIKGWFQDTWGELQRRMEGQSPKKLVVHYDADLYSSTLFALCKIDSLKRPYIAIFDEFTGDETRALFNYSRAFNADISFIGQTTFESAPNQVVCRISPRLS